MLQWRRAFGNPTLLPAPRIPWEKLSNRVWILFVSNLGQIETLLPELEKRRSEREKQRVDIDKPIQNISTQLSKLKEKKRLYSGSTARDISVTRNWRM